LRAPNDNWNGFYFDGMYPLVARLIDSFVAFADVDPDKVFIMGYSHGGYGAFAIGPKMPDRFAAIHSSAAAPTDGQSSARTLRNTRFTYMIGERDKAYGRLKRCRAFDKTIKALRGDRDDIYPVEMEYKAGHGHGGLPDRDKIRTMITHRRVAWPRDLSWELTDGVITDFYWLQVSAPARGQRVEARCHENVVSLELQGRGAVTLRLDERLVELSKPVVIEVSGRRFERRLKPQIATLCESLIRRGDPRLAASCELRIELEEGGD
jgi:pimeloyl-ACP methyl ester carboxylesterase